MPPEEEEEPVQAKLMVQRKSGEGGMAATPDLENSIESARGSGQSLSDQIREPMEQAFGADFSGDRAAHVVLATGNRNANGVEVYTFWPPPNISHYSAGTIDEVKTSTIEELSDWIAVNLNGGRPPTVEFGTPAWS